MLSRLSRLACGWSEHGLVPLLVDPAALLALVEDVIQLVNDVEHDVLGHQVEGGRGVVGEGLGHGVSGQSGRQRRQHPVTEVDEGVDGNFHGVLVLGWSLLAWWWSPRWLAEGPLLRCTWYLRLRS